MGFSKLIIKIVSFLLIVTLGVLGTYAVSEIRASQKQFEADAKTLHQVVAANIMPSLAKSLWNFDDPLIETTAKSIFHFGEFKKASVFNGDGENIVTFEQDKEELKKSKDVKIKNIEPNFSAKQPIDKERDPKNQSFESAASVKVVSLPQDSFHRLILDLWNKNDDGKTFTHVGYFVADFTTFDVKAKIQQKTRQIVILAAVLSGIIIFLMFVFLQLSVVSPVMKIAAASLEVAKGKYKKVTGIKASDEIGILAKNFNDMVGDIEVNNDRLQGIVTESRQISSQLSLMKISEQVKNSFSILSNGKAVASIYFNNICFSSHLESGYYDIENGERPVLAEIPSESDAQKEQLIPILDPRDAQQLAVVIVSSEESSELLTKVMPTLKTITNSVASAITTVRLQLTMQLVEMKSQELKKVFSHIHQGICIIDDELKVGPQYSNYLETILNEKDLAKKYLFDLIFKNSKLTSDQLSQIETMLRGSLHDSLFGFECNSEILPREIEIEKDKKTQTLEIDWLPLIDNQENVNGYMLTLRDVTVMRQLKMAAEQNRMEMDKIGQILALSASKFNSFMSAATNYLADCDKLLVQESNNIKSNFSVIMRNLHTIKGNSRTYGFSYLTEVVHDVESRVIAIAKKYENNNTASAQEDVMDINLGLKSIYNMLNSYFVINRDKLKRNAAEKDVREEEILKAINLTQKLVQNLNHSPQKEEISELHATLLKIKYCSILETLLPIQESLPTLAKQVSKPLPLLHIHTTEDWLIEAEIAEQLRGVFTHLVSNSMSHGLRQDTQGHLNFRFTSTQKNLEIVYEDSGDGLDLEKIRNAAEKKGHTGLISDEQIAMCIFESGISTAEKLSDVSGRGVGMDVIKGTIEKLNGTLNIEFNSSSALNGKRPFLIKVSLPADIALYRVKHDEQHKVAHLETAA